jgi:bifunctional non-homologous end joining protein LigD
VSRIAAQQPAIGATRGKPPQTQAPQLCSLVAEPPEGNEWVSEIKFDGYRLLAMVGDGRVRLLTRNGHDWAERLPSVRQTIGRLPVQAAMLDGELVALRDDGVSSFPGLQTALKTGRDDQLFFYVFDLLHLDGWDLRGCTLLERKRVLAGLIDWKGMLRYSDHHTGDAPAMRRSACAMHLEGIVCKQGSALYRPGRGGSWVKVKCEGRDEFIVLGLTPPGGGRSGFGALHVGYYDPEGNLQYAGGVGSGFDEKELGAIRSRLDLIISAAPEQLLVSGDPIDRSIIWVRPEVIIEVQFTDWSGSGRLRHPVYLGIREDKVARDVVQPVADPGAERLPFKSGGGAGRSVSTHKGWHGAIPPLRSRHEPVASTARPLVVRSAVVTAQAPKKAAVAVEGVQLTHPDRQLWPDVTKRDLVAYWQAVSSAALPGIAKRPLSILRCPDGINGNEQFFQKNGHGILPSVIRESSASKQPYLAIDGVAGLVAMAQMSAIELHAWGADEATPTCPDRLVFDLDPGEGVAWSDVVKAALETRDRLTKLGLASFCRTTGGKGLHVVVPLKPEAEWSVAKPFCRAFAEAMAEEHPTRFLAHLKIADRRGRILIDWLRNGLGATAVASFSPRARPGAAVATPVTWAEVTSKLDPSRFTVRTVPERLAKLKQDPWQGFEKAAQRLPGLLLTRSTTPVASEARPSPEPRRSSIVTARPPNRNQVRLK